MSEVSENMMYMSTEVPDTTLGEELASIATSLETWPVTAKSEADEVRYGALSERQTHHSPLNYPGGIQNRTIPLQWPRSQA